MSVKQKNSFDLDIAKQRDFINHLERRLLRMREQNRLARKLGANVDTTPVNLLIDRIKREKKELLNLQRLLKNPYRSTAQRGKFHAMAERGEIDKSVVKEFDRASKGLRLPKRVSNGGYKTFTDSALEQALKINLAKWAKEKDVNAQTHIIEINAELNRRHNERRKSDLHYQPKRNATASDFRQHQSKKLTDLARMFQGTANGEKRRVLESDYTPKDKYRLGYLVQLKIRDAGTTIPINFDGEAYLAADLRNNLLIVGKDARIEGVKLPPKGQLKYLGELVRIDYVTAKKHIEGGKTVRFYHKLGEVTKEMPNLFIDDEGFPVIVAGGYDVWSVGVVN